MSRSLSYLFLGFVFLFTFFACQDDRLGEDWVNIDPSGWQKDSIQVFEFEVDDTINYHQLKIGIRNSDNYRYRNLWLFVNTQTPQGKEHTDTFELMLASPEGEWHGAGWGNLYSVMAAYREVRFLETGTFKFSVQQGMRHDELEGIESVGIRIEKVK